MANIRLIFAIVIGILLSFFFITTLNSRMELGKMEQFTKQSVQHEIANLKVPRSWEKRLPKGMQADLSKDANKYLGQQAGKLHAKYISPQLVKYHTGRFLIFTGVAALVLIVLLLGRYKIFAWGFSLGSVITIIYAYISTWRYIDIGFKWLIIPLLIIMAILFWIEWLDSKKKR